MLYHVKRLLSDLRSTWSWILPAAVCTFVAALVGSYMGAFLLESLRSAPLGDEPPTQPLSFLRVIAVEDSILYDTANPEGMNLYDDPAIQILLEEIADRDDLFLFLPLDPGMLSTVAPRGNLAHLEGGVAARVAVIGKTAPFLPAGWRTEAGVSVFGSLRAPIDQIPGVVEGRFGQEPLRIVDDVSPGSVELITGSGRHWSPTSEAALLVMGVDAARGLQLWSPMPPWTLAESVSCYCPVSTMQSIAEAMSDASVEGANGVVYYAVGYEGIVGPVQQLRTFSELAVFVHGGSALLAVGLTSVLGARMVHGRRAYAFAVEASWGAPEFSLQLRLQILFFLALLAPTGLGYWLSHAILAASAWPPPASGGWVLVAGCALVILFVLAGWPHARAIHRLYRAEYGRASS